MSTLLALAGLGAYLAQEHLAYERPRIDIAVPVLPERDLQSATPPIGAPPIQKPIPRQQIDLGQGFEGEIHHRYQVSGIILTRQDFSHDTFAPVSPLDLGIGWGHLMAPETRALYAFGVGRRMIQWRALSRDTRGLDLVPHLSNNHLLPGSEAVRAQLLQLKPGMSVRLTGFLIDVTSPDQRRWRSSTKRTDYNFRGCEVMLVTKVELLDPA